MQNNFSELHDIASRSLDANLIKTERGTFLSGGHKQFRSLWTRDFCFASRGLSLVHRNDVVKSQIERLLLAKRKSDALVPRLMDSVPSKHRVLVNTVFRWLPESLKRFQFREPLTVEFLGEHGTMSLDSNLLLILAGIHFATDMRETAWFESHKEEWLKLFRFYDDYFSPKDGLIRQNRFSDWQDSVTRYGKSFYLNLLYYIVLREFHRRKFLTDQEDRLRKFRETLMNVFYDQEAKLFRGHKKLEHISLDGNLLAIDLDFFEDRDRSHSLYQNLKRHVLWQRFSAPGFTTYPDYPQSWVSWTVRVAGLRHYHDRLVWSWLVALSAKIAAQMADLEEATRILRFLEDLARRDQTICEVYDPDQYYRPFESWMYRSEAPFSWGAALTIEAVRSYWTLHPESN